MVYKMYTHIQHIQELLVATVFSLIIPLPLTSPGRGFRVVSVVNGFNIQGMTKSISLIILVVMKIICAGRAFAKVTRFL